jgi:hypothetical protein
LKGCKVSIVGTELDRASDDAYKKVIGNFNSRTGNGKGYESAFKVEDNTDPDNPNSVYYLSQFYAQPNDSTMPCAVSKQTREKYRKFYEKTTDPKQPYKQHTDKKDGHRCELITEESAKLKPIKEDAGHNNVRDVCSNDTRCKGYYVAEDVNGKQEDTMKPVLASAVPGSCKVYWSRLDEKDRPITQDKCARYMGDGVWYTAGDVCEPTCPGDKGRTWTGLCKNECLAGWGISGSTAGESCVPRSEDACPIGWVLTDNSHYNPTGVCRPPCLKGAQQERDEDGFCKYDDDATEGWTCIPGTTHKRYGTWYKTDICRPYPYDHK